jgi:hypothetical protein
MPQIVGDLEQLARGLQATSSLLGYAKVLAGKNKLIAGGAPTRVVIFPIGCDNGAADDRTVSVSSGWMLITGHFWAPDNGAAFELRRRWFQALRAQADAGGYFWKSAEGQDERWDTVPDSGEQGEEFEIDFLIRIDANLPTKSTGTVEATSLARVCTLTTDMGVGDVAAAVDSTLELPTSGVLHIDDEQMSFTSSDGTTFTGIVRGINGTTASAHASGTPVYVTT